jgi:ankyrin repeat protein
MSHTGVQIDKRLLRVAERGDAAQLSRLVSTGISVAGTDKKGNTLLHIAALANSVESCAILIAGGCDIHVKNLKGQTAAELADLKKKKKAFAWLRQQAATESEKATAKAAAVVSAAQTAPPASTSQTKAEEPSSPSQ